MLEKPGGGERIGPFLNVLGRGEEAMLKRAGGRGGPRFESLSEVLTSDQISKVREVAKQLETEVAMNQQISAGQQRAADLIKDELPNYRVPNIFNVFVTTANKVLETLGVKVGEKTLEKIATASLTAKSFDELLATLPGKERSLFLSAISDPKTWSNLKPELSTKAALKEMTSTGKLMMGAAGAAETPVMPVNNLAPQLESNMLAPRIELRGMAR